MAKANVYNIGQSVRTTFTLRDINDALFDPAILTCQTRDKVNNVYGDITEYTLVDLEITRLSLGVYYIDIDCLLEGTTYVFWQGSGNCKASKPDRWVVRGNVFD